MMVFYNGFFVPNKNYTPCDNTGDPSPSLASDEKTLRSHERDNSFSQYDQQHSDRDRPVDEQNSQEKHSSSPIVLEKKLPPGYPPEHPPEHISKTPREHPFETPSSPPSDIKKDEYYIGSGELIGAFLRRVREQQGISVYVLSQRTCISQRYLQRIEDEAWSELPQLAHVMGFVRACAQVLGCDVDTTVQAFKQQYWQNPQKLSSDQGNHHKNVAELVSERPQSAEVKQQVRRDTSYQGKQSISGAVLSFLGKDKKDNAELLLTSPATAEQKSNAQNLNAQNFNIPNNSTNSDTINPETIPPRGIHSQWWNSRTLLLGCCVMVLGGWGLMQLTTKSLDDVVQVDGQEQNGQAEARAVAQSSDTNTERADLPPLSTPIPSLGSSLGDTSSLLEQELSSLRNDSGASSSATTTATPNTIQPSVNNSLTLNNSNNGEQSSTSVNSTERDVLEGSDGIVDFGFADVSWGTNIANTVKKFPVLRPSLSQSSNNFDRDNDSRGGSTVTGDASTDIDNIEQDLSLVINTGENPRLRSKSQLAQDFGLTYDPNARVEILPKRTQQLHLYARDGSFDTTQEVHPGEAVAIPNSGRWEMEASDGIQWLQIRVDGLPISVEEKKAKRVVLDPYLLIVGKAFVDYNE